VIQEGATTGAYADGWISRALKVCLRPTEPVRSLTLCAYRPEEAGGGQVRILIDGVEAANSPIDAGPGEVTASVSREKDVTFTVEVLFDAQQKWSPAGDDRDLALMMIEMRVEHVAAEQQPVTKKREGRLFRW
jgi:hypothetical protein